MPAVILGAVRGNCLHIAAGASDDDERREYESFRRFLDQSKPAEASTSQARASTS